MGCEDSFKKVLGSGCDALVCEKQFQTDFSKLECDRMGCVSQFNNSVVGTKCDAVGCERQAT